LEVTELKQLDKLGKNIACDVELVRRYGLLETMRRKIGKGDWGELRLASQHAASRILQHYKKHGAPVTLADEPWTQREKDEAMRRGPHKSAYEGMEFLREDMSDYIDKGFWMVVPYSLLREVPNLRVSPIGLVPQPNQRPRPIVDYTYFGVNDATQPNAPVESMQFGRALERFIRHIVLANPKYGKVKLIKVDLADGFYRIWLSPTHAAKLAVAFPNADGEEPLIAIPLSLPMGWKNSPPLFSTATKTIADIANRRILQHTDKPAHRLDELADSVPEKEEEIPNDGAKASNDVINHAVPIPTTRDPHLASAKRRKLQTVDIYVDDFIAAAQGDKATLTRVRRSLLYAIDDVFRPLEPDDTETRKEPTSVKKLRKGDACWATLKEILGWLIDTEHMTLSLTPRRAERLRHLLYEEFPRNRKRAPVKEWHRLLGELRSMTLALPGSQGLFSLLQNTFRSATTADPRVALTTAVHDVLDDFRVMYNQLRHRPARLHELVPLTPTIHGNHDASGYGMGGVWYPTPTAVGRSVRMRTSPNGRRRRQHRAVPVVWRMRFPANITARLVTRENPKGDITNTDLELVGSVMHQECATQCYDIRERTTLSRTDNTGTMYWQRKGSATTAKVAAEVLRIQAMHQRHHRYIRLHDHLSGPENVDADDASRLQDLTNRKFLAHFNTLYPQKQSWQMWTPTAEMRSSLIGALRNTRQPMGSWLAELAPPTPTGTSGQNFAPIWPSTHSLKTSPTQLFSSRSSSTATAKGDSPSGAKPAATLSAQGQLKMPYVALGRRSLQWGPRTHGSHRKAAWISDLPAKSVTTRNRILHQTVSSRYRSRSSVTSCTPPSPVRSPATLQ
jgi:hypothetical protein